LGQVVESPIELFGVNVIWKWIVLAISRCSALEPSQPFSNATIYFFNTWRACGEESIWVI